MNQETADLVARCRSEVLVSPNSELPFALRHELLRSLGPRKLDDRGRAVELADGKRRRTLLALLVARRVAPPWSRDYKTPAVENLLLLVEKYLQSAVTREEVRRKTDSLQGGLLNDPQGKDSAYLAGRAAAAAGWVAVRDELLFPDEGVTAAELDDPQDPDLWDPAYFAAGAAAGGMPWTASFQVQEYRAFWLWYLDQAVPRAWTAVV